MANNLISILIPTYNRAEFLDYSLEVHVPMVEKYNIQIMIFDNASTDNTQEVVNKWSQRYSHIIYHRHNENIGGVGNFEYALQYPTSKYVWLLGDTYQINREIIESVMKILNDTNVNFDAIILNLQDKIQKSTEIYNDKNKLLNELGALITCIAVSIFRKDMISEDVLIRYRDLWFTHMAIIFEYLSDNDCKIQWLQEYSITSLTNPKLKKTNWSHTSKAFEIGCEDWTNFVMSLPPSYKLENKMKCIMDFGKVSGLFRLRKLMQFRAENLFNYEIYTRYSKYFRFTIDYPKWLVFTISIVPKSFFKILIMVYDKLKGR